jgi:hypothetical protein
MRGFRIKEPPVEPTDITIEILQDIRDGVRDTNVRLDRIEQSVFSRIHRTNTRLEKVEVRIEHVEQRLESVEKRQIENDSRLSREVVALGRTMQQIWDVLHDNFAFVRHLEDHEARITALEQHKHGGSA